MKLNFKVLSTHNFCHLYMPMEAEIMLRLPTSTLAITFLFEQKVYKVGKRANFKKLNNQSRDNIRYMC